MDESLDAAWEFMLISAAATDEGYGRPGSLGLTVLVEKARSTRITEFYPFTSLGRLCFSTGPRWWEGQGEPVPVFVTLDHEGVYRVWTGGPYVHTIDEVVEQLVTRSADQVIAEVERLLGALDQPRSS
ncbi:hypothetical protein OG455_07970 [Kitasatospora sp. NBC_01287]|uniref:hypothetical protein n=1 Tax=Kitasatospora sp. NBC_01287 TaxID=2903573 RepID=UPI0022513196|nr:hypothetical protein [Kitasatospora sp. NBC_01287]MCX4745458.1 hypothetical protein [Kitasatospora sp. NBC_01287]